MKELQTLSENSLPKAQPIKFDYALVTDFDLPFLFNSWATVFISNPPSVLFVRRPVSKRPFFSHLTISEKIIYALTGLLLLLRLALCFCRYPKVLRIFLKAKTFKSWKDVVDNLHSKKMIDRLIITTDAIVPAEVIATSPVPILNKHAGDTDLIRGLLPVFWSMLLNLPIALTVHRVDEGIDSGRVLLKQKYTRQTPTSLLNLYLKIYLRDWPKLFSGLNIDKAYVVQQTSATALYRSWPDRPDFTNFRKTSHYPLCRLGDLLFWRW